MKRKEKNIIQRLQKKDKEVISVLYDQYSASLYGIILKIVQDEVIAQDVLQEAFLKIWKNGSSYEPKKGSLFTWMLNIARNNAIDKTRSASFRHSTKIQNLDQTVYHNSSLKMENNTDVIGLKGIVDKLDEKYRTIIDLIYFNGYTQKEVEEHLNIPLGTVKSRVRIGLRELRRIFDEQKVNIIVLIISLLG
ncbi:MAG: sigma-70 family RNA polymerase sigma factor [Saprospiraceae bacterium]|nr:sigma-70 family RNA polymerase sigma factor [Saprospiraceae bacterium]